MPVSSICASASRGVSAPVNPAAAPTSAAPLRKSRLLSLWLSLIRSSLSKYDSHCQRAVSSIPAISVVDVHKSFGRLAVLKGVSFDVPRGSVVSMIGASGSGKSTLLRCINHLETPSAGEIYIDGEPMHFRVAGDGQRKPRPIAEINRLRRDLGMVFQQFNLWPHMTVLGNVVEAPRRVRRLKRAEAGELALESLRRGPLPIGRAACEGRG